MKPAFLFNGRNVVNADNSERYASLFTRLENRLMHGTRTCQPLHNRILMKLAAVRYYPWAKANLNHVSQALIISAASVAAYFIMADRAITQCARRNAQYEESVSKRAA